MLILLDLYYLIFPRGYDTTSDYGNSNFTNRP